MLMSKQKQNEVKKLEFTKAQILSSKKYEDKRDVISALLAENKTYSFNDVDNMISKFKKGVVK